MSDLQLEPGQQLDDGRDYFPASQWRTASAAQVGFNASRLDAMLRDAAARRWGSLHGLVIVRNGYAISSPLRPRSTAECSKRFRVTHQPSRMLMITNAI
jgi:hypothetical protein